MFRCSECGSEYIEKPDFCECGNDIFEEIVSEVDNIPLNKNPKFKIEKSDILSWLLFLFLIILSVLVLIFFPKISDNQVDSTQKIDKTKTVVQNDDIPSLYSFWVDCKPQTVQESVVEQIKEAVLKPMADTKKESKTVSQPKQTSKPVVKQTSSQQQKTVSKPVQQSKPKVSQTTVPTTGKAQRSMMSYEVVNYRTALRQRLLSNLDIYKVQGSGKCGIEFSIDENGKLINRKFIYQSENKSVNDEVYKMLMRTPQFNPPPESYINKKIRMTFALDSESYEINFID